MKDIQNIDVIVPEVISFLWNIRFSDALLNDVTLHEKCTFKNNHQKIKSILCYMVYCSENKRPKNFFDITVAISPVIKKYFEIIYKDQTLSISLENNGPVYYEKKEFHGKHPATGNTKNQEAYVKTAKGLLSEGKVVDAINYNSKGYG